MVELPPQHLHESSPITPFLLTLEQFERYYPIHANCLKKEIQIFVTNQNLGIIYLFIYFKEILTEWVLLCIYFHSPYLDSSSWKAHLYLWRYFVISLE